MRKRIEIAVIALIIATFASCNKIKEYSSDKPIVEVNGEKLYQSDIDAIVPQDATPEDSALYAEDYIKKWAVRILLYQMATHNVDVSQEQEIEQLVEDYRRSLMVHLYQRKLVEQKVKAPTEEELRTYYDLHSEIFRLHDDLFRGLYMRLPKGTRKLDLLRRYFRNFEKNLPEIEKFGYQNAVSYEYLDENWVKCSDFANNYPEEIPLGKGLHEASDEQYVYFLYIINSKHAGEVMPFDFAKQEIMPILQEQKSFDFIKKFEDELYNRAVNKNDIIRHQGQETSKFNLWKFWEK